MSKVQIISVISFLSYCIIVGSLVFSRGFLLNRQIIQETAGPCSNIPYNVNTGAFRGETHDKDNNQQRKRSEQKQDGLLSAASSWCNSSPPFSKLILVLVDALRFDFVQRMPFLSRITKQNSSHPNQGISSCLFSFVADPPTTTMQRLKALMTGTMPTFIDASANFNSYEVEEDSLVYQLEAAGKRIAFLGDDTWLSLFPKKYFKSPFVEAHPSFNAWDLDTVDRAVNKTLREIFLPAHMQQWDVLITHLLGVDHCGHRYGPSHPEMVRKLNEADAIVEYVFNSMDNNTLLVIFGDHGMTSTGDHGGDSKDEVESAVIFLSKQIQKNKQTSPPFQCSQQLSISQIDLVPTLSPLMGIPIPYSNIGQIIPDFLVNKTYSDAVAANVAQVHKYIQHFSTMLSSGVTKTTGSHNNENSGETLTEQYEKIEEAFMDYQSSRNSTTRARLHKLSQIYLAQVKAVAVSTWTQFNLPMIYTGLTITLLSVLSLCVYLTNVPRLFSSNNNNNSNHSNNNNNYYYYSVLSWLWPSLSHWSVLCTFIYHSASSSGLLGIIVSTLSGILVFLLLLLYKIYQLTVIRRRKSVKDKNIAEQSSRKSLLVFESVLEIVPVALYILTCLVVFSNSFVINEGYVLGATIVLVTLIHVIQKSDDSKSSEYGFLYGDNNLDLQRQEQEDFLIQLPQVKKCFRCKWCCFFILAAIIRTSSLFFRCREEQVDCNEEFLLHKQLSSLPEDWLVHKYLRYGISLLTLAVFVVSFRHWMIYRSCIFSRKPRAIIARFIPSLLVVLLGVFWALQGLPYISSNASKVRLLMNYLPLVYQVVTISSIICIWLKPVCCIGHLRSYSFTNNYSSSTTTRGLKNPQCSNNVIMQPSGHSSCKTDSYNLSTTSRNGIKETVEGLNGTVPNNMKRDQVNNSCTSWILNKMKKTSKLRTLSEQYFHKAIKFGDCYSEDTYSSCFLTFGALLTLLLVQITSTGIAPALILQAYAIVCLVGICRRSSKTDTDSWSTAVAWTLCSQYFFYATGHQPLFSAIPWDSAFVGTGDGSGLAASTVSWTAWGRAAFAVAGNLHVSQIITSFLLPLMIYWKVDKSRLESLMGNSERKKAYTFCGKYLALHGIKLLACMTCAAWHRRHLMVWKIFAPKFIFEAVSFIVTSSVVLLSMVFVSRINYYHQQARSKANNRTI